MILVIIANLTHCRFYGYTRKPLVLDFLHEISHEELRLKKSELLTSDRPGRYQKKDNAKSAYEPHTDEKEIEFTKFAKEIAYVLNKERNKKTYTKIIFFAPPHMQGLITQQLDKHVEKCIAHKIHKDYVHLSDQDLLTYLHENVFDLGIED